MNNKGKQDINKAYSRGYKEDNRKLSCRIDIHSKFAEHDLDSWILNIVKIQGDEKILDIGCGDGKQILSFGRNLTLGGEIIGIDIARDLLEKAKASAEKHHIKASFLLHDMNNPLPFKDNSFDFIYCIFAIYYVENPERLILEVKRLLKDGGKFFVAGPTPKNTESFWRLHEKITDRKIPEISLKRRARIRDTFIPLIKRHFKNTTIHILKNTIRFPDSDPVMDYYTSSLLLKESSRSKEEERRFSERMRREVERTIEKKSTFIIKKEVYGILAFA